jgi:uncharacterized RDD family membrane protein YckC
MEGMPPQPPFAQHPEAPWQPTPPPAENRSFGGRPFAGFGYRVASYLFDAGIALAAGVVAAFAAGGKENWQSADGEATLTLTAIVVWFLVTSVAMGVFKGQSLGKRLVGTRVVQIGGAPAGFGTSLLRDQLARLLYIIPLFAVVDCSWAAASNDSQTLRDKMTSTYVVRERATVPRAWGVALAATACLAVWVAGTSALDAGSGDEPGEGYTDLDRQAFTDACQDEGASRNQCVCMFEHISARVPYDEFQRADSANSDDWPRPVQDAAARAIDICVN